MTPALFDSLTFAEIRRLLDGARKRYERQRRIVAWQTAHLLNVAGKKLKKPVSVDKLLGPVKSGGTKGTRTRDAG